MTRFVRLGALAAVACIGAALGPAPVDGQNARRVDASVMAADSIRVGVPFVFRVTLTQEQAQDVQFPALIELPDALEQRGPVRIRSSNQGLDWQAEYTVVAWRADTLSIAPIPIEFGTAGTDSDVAELPIVMVHSVLPADEGELELKDSRPFLSAQVFSWWWVALLAALAALALWAWRRRETPVAAAPVVPSGPGHRALEELEGLRAAWLEGGMSGDQFYDGYEAALRRYAQATRGWARSKGLAGLGGRDTGMWTALWHSVLARFGRVRPRSAGPIEDLDVGAAFIRSEMPPPPTAQAEPSDDSEVEPDMETTSDDLDEPEAT